MLRRLLALFLALLIAPTVWLREAPQPPNASQAVAIVPLALPDQSRLGPFRLANAWQLTSPNSDFGGYSGLLIPAPGWLIAFGDAGQQLTLPMPGYPGQPRQSSVLGGKTRLKAMRDVEAATRDPATGKVWLALEGRNGFLRLDGGGPAFIAAPAMAGWGANSGPEAMTRLADGRFIALAEGYASWFDRTAHPALLWPGAPRPGLEPLRFRFIAPAGYRPTDMAQLPDGRVLILVRRLVWPMPPRFAVRVLLADPAKIAAAADWPGQELARLDATGLDENYEGIAIERLPAGKVAVWLISDANGAATQRTLLLRLTLDPAELPRR